MNRAPHHVRQPTVDLGVGPHNPHDASQLIAALTVDPSGEVPVDQLSVPEISVTNGLAATIGQLLGDDLPVAIECYDGSRIGPRDASTRLVIRSPDVLRYLIAAPGELGFGRAYVSGQLDVEGSIFDALELRRHFRASKLSKRQWFALARAIGAKALRPPPPRPAEEVRLRGRRHSRSRDAAAISHHYDVSNRFYELVLGPSMTYSCAVWPSRHSTLEAAQAAKNDLVCRKLDLRPGMRLLDVGCGWGGMAMHAAGHYGVHVVGVTISERQAEWARRAVADAGLSGLVEIREQDYRDLSDAPFDAISSIGMFEHVGVAHLSEYFDRLHALLRPGGRLLNHGISRPFGQRPRFARRGFIDRYVFPDGELHEIGSVVSGIQAAGFEARHVESLREHYALTLRAWVDNLERAWEEAVVQVGPARARVWRLYMAGCATGFEDGGIQVHQVLAVRPDAGASHMPLRPTWHPPSLAVPSTE
jgi:cyclopropane-fatty-acyl-phospholipid synthase